MQMQPQAKPQLAQAQAPQAQPNPMQATAGALQKAKSTGPQPNQPQQPGQDGGMDDFSSEITENLQQHLNTLDPRQQKFLADSLQHYANIVIPILGIVCGQEVFQYFLQLYQQNFAKGMDKQQNSAPNQMQGQQNGGQAPTASQGMPQQQPQGQAPAQQAQPPQQQPQM